MNDFFNYWIIQSTGLTKQVIVFISESFESFTQINCSKTLIDLLSKIWRTKKTKKHKKMAIMYWKRKFLD